MRPGAGLYSRKIVFKHTLRYRPDKFNQTPECAWQSSQPLPAKIVPRFPLAALCWHVAALSA